MPMNRVSIIMVALLACGIAHAGVTDTLTWDDQVPAELRAAVRRAVAKEKTRLEGEPDASGQKSARVLTNQGVEIVGGKPTAMLTIQRCLPDRLVTEQWRYTFDPASAPDLVVADRTKVAENGGWLRMDVAPAASARALPPVTFEHDHLSVTLDRGAYLTRRVGDEVVTVFGTGSGRIKLGALDPQSAQVLRRVLEVDALDTAFDAFVFHVRLDDPRLAALASAVNGTATPASPADVAQLGQLRSTLVIDESPSPEDYSLPREPNAPRWFGLWFRTKDHGWLSYSVSDADQAISLRRLEGRPAFRTVANESWKTVLRFPSPEQRARTAADREHLAPDHDAEPQSYDVRAELENDRLVLTTTVSLRVVRSTSTLGFAIGGSPRGLSVDRLFGNPVVRFVRDADGNDLPFVPRPNSLTRIYGFSDVNNTYIVHLPREAAAGTMLALTIRYENERGIFWSGPDAHVLSWLPFLYDAMKPVPLRSAVRGPAAKVVMGNGKKDGEEQDGAFRTTRWQHVLMPGDFFEAYAGEGTVSSLQKDGVNATLFVTTQSKWDSAKIEYALRATLDSLNFIKHRFNSGHPFTDFSVTFSNDFAPAIAKASWDSARRRAAGFETLSDWSDAGQMAAQAASAWWTRKLIPASDDEEWLLEALPILTASWYEEDIDPGKHHARHVQGWHDLSAVCATPYTLQEIAVARSLETRYEFEPRCLLKYKGPHVLQMIGAQFGDDVLSASLVRLARLPAGTRIATSDLEAAVKAELAKKQGTPAEIGWFFDQWVRGSGIPRVTVKLGPPKQGDRGWVVKGSATQDVLVDGKPVAGRTFRHLALPFAADDQRQVFDLDAASAEFELVFDKKPKKIEVDPERRMLFTVVRAD